MVRHLFYMWKTKIIAICQEMLQAAISTLQEVIKNTQHCLKGIILHALLFYSKTYRYNYSMQKHLREAHIVEM